MKAGSHPESHKTIDPVLFLNTFMIAPLSVPNSTIPNETHDLQVDQGSAERLQLDGICRRITW